MNNDHIQNFQKRLLNLFETKAQEFTRYSQEDPRTATVTKELAGLYNELAEMMKV